MSERQNAKHTQACLTRCGLADGGVIGAEFKAIHAETVEAAVCVDAALRTWVGGCALVYIHTRLPIPLELETGMTPALKGPRAQEICQNLTAYGFSHFSLLVWTNYKRLSPPVIKPPSVNLIHVFSLLPKA